MYSLNNSNQTIHHEPVKDVKDMLEKCKSDKGPLTYCKNLFIVNKKSNEYMLIVAIHVSLLSRQVGYRYRSKSYAQVAFSR